MNIRFCSALFYTIFILKMYKLLTTNILGIAKIQILIQNVTEYAKIFLLL